MTTTLHTINTNKIINTGKTIDTEAVSSQLRGRSIDLGSGRLLITKFAGTDQEKDLTEPANCAGFGRIRHFRRDAGAGWPPNPLPIDPTRKALALPPGDMIRAQVFQNAACNWRCWYCYVPFNMLSANPRFSDWITPADLVDLYMSQSEPPAVIDLTGGQPDLVPEWVPWTMRALKERGLDRRVYLWSDDNLSNDYFWRYLSDADRELVAGYRNYGRVCCFKGFNRESFVFNTRAEPELFDQQFALMARLLTLGLDIYAYATFTTLSPHGISDDMARFVDRLQALDANLPLRTVPLEIQVYTPVESRIDGRHEEAMRYQHTAIAAWQSELARRFTAQELRENVADVPLNCRRGG